MPCALKDEKPETKISFSMAVPSSLSSLNRDGSRSAFTPYKPTTVLTNLQRGNVQTQTSSVLPERGMHQLAAQGELFVSNTVLDEKFRVNSKDIHGLTALMWAASYGQVETVKNLLDSGACVSIAGYCGETALSFASCAGHTPIVKDLISRGAPIDIKDQDGNTALMYAVFNNHAGCVQELLTAGADITLLNEALESAFDIAIKRRSRNAQAILEKHMLALLQSGLKT